MKTKGYLIDSSKLNKLLAMKDLSVITFSDKFGCAPSTVYAWLNGSRISLRKLDYMCRFFNVTRQELIRGESQAKPQAVTIDGQDYYRQRFLAQHPNVQKALNTLIDEIRNAENSYNTLSLGV